MATITEIKELRQKPSEFEKTLLVTFLLEEPNEFETGQNIALFPKNNDRNVERAMNLFKVSPDQRLEFEIDEGQTKLKTKVPNGSSFKMIFEEMIGI